MVEGVDEQGEVLVFPFLCTAIGRILPESQASCWQQSAQHLSPRADRKREQPRMCYYLGDEGRYTDNS